MSSLPGTWGGLRLIEELGRGSFGRVYRAWDDTLAREVALKIIRVPQADSGLAAGVLREGRMLARVRHSNVVAVYGALQVGDEIGLWMELIKGRRLADIVRTDGPMSAEEAAVIAVSLCHALSAVHGAGLLHRDLKAHNVMREAGGRIVLMDFGAGRDMTMAGNPNDYTGTPLYMAPEVLAGRPASAASDIYSLGVLLYFLVTGQYPYEGKTAADVVVAQGLGQRRLLSDSRADLPDTFVRVVERALDASPRHRYTSAGAVLDELTEAASSTARGWRATDSGRVVPTAAPALERRSMAAIATASVAVSIAAVGFLGFLTTVASDTTVGVEAGFSRSSPLSWFEVGLRSLVAPVVYTMFFVLVYRVALSLLRLIQRIAPAARMLRMRFKASRALGRLGLWDPANVAQVVVVLQIAVLAAFWWAFRDLFSASFTLISTADASQFAPLRPDSAAPLYYRLVLTLALVAMIAVWYRLLTATSGSRPDRATTVGGVMVIVTAVLMLEVPYNLFHRNERPRADFDGRRCYVTGEQGSDVLLFCPDNPPPRIQVVGSGDPRLRRTGDLESIFSLPAQARPVDVGRKD